MSHWYSFGRDRADVGDPSAPLPTTSTAGPSQGEGPSEDEEPPPPLIKGRTWKNKKKKLKKLKIQYYKRYELQWPKLLEWLKGKFPDVEFEEELDATRDFFVFYTPRDLNDSEFEEIRKLRDDYREDEGGG